MSIRISPTEILTADTNLSYEDGFYETTGSIIRYCSPTGSDTTGDGSVGNPYRQITRAYQDIPRLLKHPCAIRCAAGTYTNLPEINIGCEGLGSLAIEGALEVFAAGPYTLASVTTLVPKYEDAAIQFEVAAAGWVADQWYPGFWIEMLTGVAAGLRYPIFKNTATVVTTGAPYYGVYPAMGDTFRVVRPSVTVNTSTFWIGGGAVGYSTVGFFNIKIASSVQPNITKTNFSFGGLALVNTQKTVYVGDAQFGYYNSSGEFSLVDSFYDTYPDVGAIVAYDGTTVPGAGVLYAGLSAGANSVVTSCHTRHGIKFVGCVNYSYSTCGGIFTYYNNGLASGSMAYDIYIEMGGTTADDYALYLNLGSYYLNEIWVEKSNDYAIFLAGAGSSLELTSLSGTNANVAGSAALLIGYGCKVASAAFNVLKSATGIAYTFYSSGGTYTAWPPARYSFHDPTGSSIFTDNGSAIGLGSMTIAPSLNDDASYDLPASRIGMGLVQAGDNQEYGLFTFTSTGACTVVSGSANFVNTDTDVKLCVFTNGSNAVRIRNRLGGTKVVRAVIWFT